MKPTLNLFFDMEFTSLSPDAQIISLGIVSDEWNGGVYQAIKGLPMRLESKSFYAEFSDFQIDLCDDWVKENVVGKLKYFNVADANSHDYLNLQVKSNTAEIEKCLTEWLSQFSDYNLQFVGDCATFDWYHLLHLIGGWERQIYVDESKLRFQGYEPEYFKIGLPKLPDNISPVPQDLNDLIAIKKGISVREAFDLDRECEAAVDGEVYPDEKHNSLWDAKVIKAIYNNLK
jgi:hypothetical protein